MCIKKERIVAMYVVVNDYLASKFTKIKSCE